MSNSRFSAIPVAPRLLSVAIAAAIVSAPSLPVYAAEDAAPVALEQVLVSARRDVENVQDVPVSMQVITADTIQNLRMTSPTDLSKIAAGLNITRTNSGGAPVIILRGVRWNDGSGQAAIPIYLNEISFDPGAVLANMYDVDRVEVLRGPQGTTRGAPSIPGAVTISSRQADLDEMGGYISGQYGENDSRNLQGAVGFPILPGKLGVRIAGFRNHTDGGGVSSVNSSRDPSFDQESGRVSFRFEPIDTLSADLMLQRTDQQASTFTHLVGSGSAGVPSLGIPANYNGRALELGDYRGVQEGANKTSNRTDLITFNLNWEVLGHTLAYNFGSQDGYTIDRDKNGGASDLGNQVIGYDDITKVFNGRHDIEYFVNELRLSSIRDGERFIDYDVGVYSQKADGTIFLDGPAAYLPGAFGNPSGLPSPYANSAAIAHHTLRQNTNISLETDNWSVYGNVNLHLTDDTELSVGLRDIHDKRPTELSVGLLDGFAAFPNPTGLPCGSIGFAANPVYPATCDFMLEGGKFLPERSESKETATIYNASLSHKFTPDIMGYVTTGTSWRAGLPAIGNSGLPANIPDPEEATSYEIGVKTMWLQTLRVNFDIYQLDYDGQLTQFQFVPYFNSVSGQTSQTSQSYFRNADSQVRGAELEIAARPFSELTLGANISYSEIKSAGGQVPCNDPSRPITSTNVMNTCPLDEGTNLNTSPRLSAVFNGEYVLPLGAVDAYLNGVVNYSSKNPNYGTSVETTPSFTVVDLFFGVRDVEGSWDVGLYAKNAFDKQVELSRNVLLTSFDGVFGPSGYDQVSATSQREIGLSARYAFGSK